MTHQIVVTCVCTWFHFGSYITKCIIMLCFMNLCCKFVSHFIFCLNVWACGNQNENIYAPMDFYWCMSTLSAPTLLNKLCCLLITVKELSIWYVANSMLTLLCLCFVFLAYLIWYPCKGLFLIRQNTDVLTVHCEPLSKEGSSFCLISVSLFECNLSHLKETVKFCLASYLRCSGKRQW